MAKITKQDDGSVLIQYTRKEREQMAQAEAARQMLVAALLNVGRKTKEAC